MTELSPQDSSLYFCYPVPSFFPSSLRFSHNLVACLSSSFLLLLLLSFDGVLLCTPGWLPSCLQTQDRVWSGLKTTGFPPSASWALELFVSTTRTCTVNIFFLGGGKPYLSIKGFIFLGPGKKQVEAQPARPVALLILAAAVCSPNGGIFLLPWRQASVFPISKWPIQSSNSPEAAEAVTNPKNQAKPHSFLPLDSSHPLLIPLLSLPVRDLCFIDIVSYK